MSNTNLRESAGATRLMVHRRGTTSTDSRFYLISDLEDAIAELPNVLGVAIHASESAIEEVHVTCTPGANPKSLVRNIETLLFVNFNIHLDHRKIGIAPSNHPPTPTLHRPLIHSVRRLDIDEDARRIEVELQAANQVVVGQCPLDGDTDEVHAASLALIDALVRLTGFRNRLHLRDARLVNMGDHRIALVLLTWGDEHAADWFSGSALADTDPLAAAARASLDAVNRKLVRLPLLASK